MNGGGRWHWERRGKIALVALVGFQVAIFIAGKVDAAMRSQKINDAVASAEGGDKALALVGGILGAASAGYVFIWVWMIGTALLAGPALIFRPRRVGP
jgi:hypothetical protein